MKAQKNPRQGIDRPTHPNLLERHPRSNQPFKHVELLPTAHDSRCSTVDMRPFVHEVEYEDSYPQTILIGTPKGGTTSFWGYAVQHPDISKSMMKEPRFWDILKCSKDVYRLFLGNVSLRAMQPFAESNEDIFDFPPFDHDSIESQIIRHKVDQLLIEHNGLQPDKVLADYSTTYAIHPLAPRRIHYAIPDVRIGLLLRDPVARAYSHYTMMLDAVTMSFADIVAIQIKEAPTLLQFFRKCSPNGQIFASRVIHAYSPFRCKFC